AKLYSVEPWLLVPHILGAPASLDRWDLGIPVIEDCAMALGARLQGAEVGRWGRLSVFSFYATKMISTAQGGMLLTGDGELAAEALDLITYDNRPSWRPAWNYPMSDVAAALGRVQLRHLDAFLERRAAIAARYRELCTARGIAMQAAPPGGVPNHFRFTLLLEDRPRREEVRAALALAGIESKPPVYRPLHRYLDLDPDLFPATEEIQSRALSIPIYPSLSDEELKRVLAALESALV
ncbi:MAG: DegT/DnrJ/EryC1/StrS family aminotransferase, partial [Planctomycetota bacterium]